jgi:hypothetical protein
MTHAQLLYLILVVVAFLIFTGSLLVATLSTLSLPAPDRDAEAGGRRAGPHRSDHPS